MVLKTSFFFFNNIHRPTPPEEEDFFGEEASLIERMREDGGGGKNFSSFLSSSSCIKQWLWLTYKRKRDENLITAWKSRSEIKSSFSFQIFWWNTQAVVLSESAQSAHVIFLDTFFFFFFLQRGEKNEKERGKRPTKMQRYPFFLSFLMHAHHIFLSNCVLASFPCMNVPSFSVGDWLLSLHGAINIKMEPRQWVDMRRIERKDHQEECIHEQLLSHPPPPHIHPLCCLCGTVYSTVHYYSRVQKVLFSLSYTM